MYSKKAKKGKAMNQPIERLLEAALEIKVGGQANEELEKRILRSAHDALKNEQSQPKKKQKSKTTSPTLAPLQETSSAGRSMRNNSRKENSHSKRPWLRSSLALLCLLTGLALLLLWRGYRLENDSTQDAREDLSRQGLHFSENASFTTKAHKEVELESGWAFLNNTNQSLKFKGAQISEIKGKAVALAAQTLPHQDFLKNLPKELTKGNIHLEKGEKEMLMNPKNWVVVGGMALCLLSGELKMNDHYLQAKEKSENSKTIESSEDKNEEPQEIEPKSIQECKDLLQVENVQELRVLHSEKPGWYEENLSENFKPFNLSVNIDKPVELETILDEMIVTLEKYKHAGRLESDYHSYIFILLKNGQFIKVNTDHAGTLIVPGLLKKWMSPGLKDALRPWQEKAEARIEAAYTLFGNSLQAAIEDKSYQGPSFEYRPNFKKDVFEQNQENPKSIKDLETLLQPDNVQAIHLLDMGKASSFWYGNTDRIPTTSYLDLSAAIIERTDIEEILDGITTSFEKYEHVKKGLLSKYRSFIFILLKNGRFIRVNTTHAGSMIFPNLVENWMSPELEKSLEPWRTKATNRAQAAQSFFEDPEDLEKILAKNDDLEVAFLKEKIIALDLENLRLKKEIAELEAENKKLKTEQKEK